MNNTILSELNPNFPNGYTYQNNIPLLDNQAIHLISISDQTGVLSSSVLQSTSLNPQIIERENSNVCGLTTSASPKMKKYRGCLLHFLRKKLDKEQLSNSLKWVDKKNQIGSLYLPDARKGEVPEEYKTILKEFYSKRPGGYTNYSIAKNKFQNALKRSDYLTVLKLKDNDPEIIIKFANELEIEEKKRMKKGKIPSTLGDDSLHVAVDSSTVNSETKMVDTLSPASSGYYTGEDHNEMDAYDQTPNSENCDLMHAIDSSANTPVMINDVEKDVMDVDENPDDPIINSPLTFASENGKFSCQPDTPDLLNYLLENFDSIDAIDFLVNTPVINDVEMDAMKVDENPVDPITDSPLISASENDLFCHPIGYIPDFGDLLKEDQTPFKKLFASTENLNTLKDSDVLTEHQSFSVQPDMDINVNEKFYWRFSEKLSCGIFTIMIYIKEFIENDSEAERKASDPLGVWEPGLMYDYELEVEDKLYVYLKPHNI